MSNPLTSTLAKLFRDRATVTRVRTLQREGHDAVRVLDLAHFDEIVRTALERVLLEALDDPVEARRLARDAQNELLQGLGERGSLTQTNDRLRAEQRRLEEHVRSLEAALGSAEGELHQAGPVADEPSLRDRLTAVWDEWFSATAERHRERTPMVDELLADLRAPLFVGTLECVAASTPAPQAPPPEDPGRVQNLERRVAKLNGSLAEARGLLSRLREGRDTADDGVASIHREVQGLASEDQHFGKKQALLREVFKMNVTLKRALDSGDAPSDPDSSTSSGDPTT